MKLSFYNPNEIEKNIKATVHISGKLGFSGSAIKSLNINENKSIGIARNGEDEKDENLYLVVFENINNQAFKIIKAGEYYYINTKALFDNLKLDYKNKKIIFDIEKLENNNEIVYILYKRELEKKNEKDN
jgi:hypothetical protein